MLGTPQFDAERLRRLAAFLPRLEAANFQSGEWTVPERTEAGVIELGGFNPSSVVSDFVTRCYEAGWVQWPDFDWVTWKSSAEAVHLHDDPTAIERATPEQVSRLLTVLIRQDRFAEGTLDAAYESGFLVRILRRIATLAADSLE